MGKAENEEKGVNSRRRKASRDQETRQHGPAPDSSSAGEPGEGGGSGFAAEANGLLGQIRAQVEGAGEELQRFLGLLDAFVDIIPDEQDRYSAAVKALSHATGLTVKDVLAAADRQLAELKGQREGFSEALARWREDLHLHAAKSREIRSRIGALEREIAELEAMEKEALSQLVTGEKEVARAAAQFDSMADEFHADIETARQKILDMVSADGAPARKAPASRKKKEPVDEPPDLAEDEGIGLAAQESDHRKICSDCKCPMDWHEIEKKWKCFVCANESD